MKHICVAIVFLILTIGTFGQSRTTTEADYNSARKSAFNKVNALLRRVITKTTTYKAGEIDTIRTLTIETFPNGDNRWNSVTTRSDQIIETLQLIYLGKYEYRKEGETDWKKRCVKGCSEVERGGGFGIAGWTELPKVQQFLITEASFNSQPATVYVFYRVYDYGRTLNFFEDKMWIGSNGLILKEESTTSNIFPDNLSRVEVSIYEYNPKDISPLEAPIK